MVRGPMGYDLTLLKDGAGFLVKNRVIGRQA